MIPDWLGSSLSALQLLDLRSCSITGPIPSSLGLMNRLQYLYLSNNFLIGTIPSSLGRLSSLLIIDLSQNSLTGPIPSDFSALRNITCLSLSSNYLSDLIPLRLSSISSLRFLDLSNNSLSGTIPAQLGNLSRLVKLNLGKNYLSGLLPDTLRSLAQLQHLDVSNNQFTGFLPNFTAAFQAKAVLNFSNNLFYGNFTLDAGNFSVIDISDNYIQGLRPENTRSNIAGNCFRNVSNQKRLEDCRRFYKDRGLEFQGQALADPPAAADQSRKRGKLLYVFVGVFGGFGVSIILALVLILLLRSRSKRNETHRGSANVGPVLEGGLTSPHSKFSCNLTGLGKSFEYEQIVKATDNFSCSNLVKHGHAGDLYQGTLEDGFSVVIKRVDLHSINQESLMSELDLFGKVSHPGLVPLLGHALENENEKFLVYKYMPNRDLSTSLYRITDLEDDGLQSLDWITRLKIAIGAAECLSYLHHECDPPLVHRDVQASSILLDDKYEVRLGSLSKVCAHEGHHNGITRLLRMAETSEAGAIGSTCSCSYDVYCFGKVLLELVTGKLGISKSDNASTKEWLEKTLPFISIFKKEQVSKIIDQSLVIDEDLLEEVWAVAIVAKSCLRPRPSRRPLMRHILRALENPFKVVRDEQFNSSSRLRTTSSRKSWSSAFFGSWRLGSLEHSSNTPDEASKESSSEQKQSDSQGSGTYAHSYSQKRISREIFPEPIKMPDLEKQTRK